MVLISFKDLYKIHIFPKADICSYRIDEIMSNYLSNPKWAWQVQFLGHTLHILEKWLFSEALQIILLSFVDISNDF